MISVLDVDHMDCRAGKKTSGFQKIKSWNSSVLLGLRMAVLDLTKVGGMCQEDMRRNRDMLQRQNMTVEDL